jgi:enoyl-CoA hydratase/carnithine racemase
MSVLLYEKRDQIAYITLNRPDSLNALNNELIEAVGDALVDYRDDPSLLVAIMTGTGRAFSVGADLKEMTSEGQSAGARPLRTPIREEVWKPIICAIDGYALAGGLGMALQCDIRVATERSRFGDVETRVSAWGYLGGIKMMPMGEALHMFLTGTHISADEAYRLGLVHKVVPDREAMVEEAQEIAEKIKLCAPLAIQAVKRLAYMTLTHTGEEVDELSHTLRQQVAQTEDAREGPRAFAEKRKPVWKMR